MNVSDRLINYLESLDHESRDALKARLSQWRSQDFKLAEKWLAVLPKLDLKLDGAVEALILDDIGAEEPSLLYLLFLELYAKTVQDVLLNEVHNGIFLPDLEPALKQKIFSALSADELTALHQSLRLQSNQAAEAVTRATIHFLDYGAQELLSGWILTETNAEVEAAPRIIQLLSESYEIISDRIEATGL